VTEGGRPPSGAGAHREILDRVGRFGPLPFATFVDTALYGAGGFFTAGGGAGRRGDFITSPELGPLFGVVVSRAVDAEWERLGRPDPFVVVEAGAGTGALARSVLDAGPACLPALRYVLVERSVAMRERIAERLPVEPAANLLGSPTTDDDAEQTAGTGQGAGPVVTVLDHLPGVRIRGFVLANELLDNLPFDLLERRDGGWAEVRVGADGDRLTEVLVDVPAALAARADRLAPAAATGSRIPLQAAAGEWLRTARSLVQAGRVVVVDYAADTPTLARQPWREWLRTYRDHQRGGHPLDTPGHQDITCEVAVDQLARVHRVERDRSQADWLRANGLEPLVADARRVWRERAHIGDLEAMKARSRVGEADALTDPAGLGAFRVLEWSVAP
jgi:SAM-dependent MidA family methyltransferase